jgi:hypothetical protein
MKVAILAVVLVAVAAGAAEAYPQFQLSKDQTCASCHISPAGGGLLNENGQTVSETMSQWGTNPGFFYGKVPTPDWLVLGGDFRGAYGYLQTPQKYLVAFPMQADVYASAAFSSFRIYLEGGYRPAIYNALGEAQFQAPWSREHWVSWQSDAGSNEGLFVRVGRFMPVFGLRFAEHPIYTRRFGGTQLYGETYGVSASYIKPEYEAHITGFIKDPLIDTVEHSNGAAAYGEYRLDPRTSVGLEGMVQHTDIDTKLRAGVTAKKYLPKPDLLFQGELQFVNDRIKPTGAPNAIVGYALASWFARDAVMVDVGAGYYNENIRIKYLDRECVDLNVHWFMISHFEALLTTRIEFFGFGNGGPTGGYALLMGHYRL